MTSHEKLKILEGKKVDKIKPIDDPELPLQIVFEDGTILNISVCGDDMSYVTYALDKKN